ncbi:MAG: hypothetical protein GYB64_07395 [Chloroflexi bacterium]|nr:hypothetical protein [Chloroflexota bacterium]
MRQTLALGIVLIGLAACAPAAAEQVAPIATDVPVVEPTEVPAPTAVPTEADPVSQDDADTAEQPAAEEQAATEAPVEDTGQEGAEVVVAIHRAAPAPLDSFVNDNPAFVGTTGRPQVIDFFTTWCNICNAIKADIHSLEAEYWGRVDFIYLNRELPENAAVVDRFGVQYQPEFVILDADGNKVAHLYGAPGNALREQIDALLVGR